MENIKQWKDVKVGDTVYFADEFAEPEPVVVEKIDPEKWDRYLRITVSGPSFNGETRVARVVSPSHDKSLHEQLEKLEKDRAYIEERIAHIKGDIETVANIQAE